MFKSELPDTEGLYLFILNWDYYKDLVEENIVTNHIEEDNVWEEIRGISTGNLEEVKMNVQEDGKMVVKKEPLERIPITFQSSEDYVKIWMKLFIFEAKAQITRSKIVEKEESEKFLLSNVKPDEKKKCFNFHFARSLSKGVNYSGGDLILAHRHNINEEHVEQFLGIVSTFGHIDGLLIARIVFNRDGPNAAAQSKVLTQNSEFFITRICNLATIVREYQALNSIDNLKLAELLINPMNIHVDYYLAKMFNPQDYFFMPRKLESKLRLYFNQSQLEALRNSIKKRGVTLIQGPPGTGKSTTILGIISVILNSLLKKEGMERRNSVINMVNSEILYEDSNTLGSNSRTHMPQYIKSHPWLYSDENNKIESPNLHNFDEVNFTIDELFGFTEYPSSKQSDNYKILTKPVDEDAMPPEKILVCAPSNVAIDEIIRKMVSAGLLDAEGNSIHPKFVRIGPNYHESLKEYSLDYLVTQKLEVMESFNMGGSNTNMARDKERIKHEILAGVKIVCTTLSMAGSNILTALNQKFDTIVVDEAAQAVEIATLIPLKYGCERLILVGDPQQLAATVFSRTALKYNYDQSLFKRFQDAGHEVTVLRTQYRMHKTISKFISDTFYQGLLDDDENIASTTENELCLSHPAFQPLTYFDIESDEDFWNNSYYNEGQINVIVELVKMLKGVYKDNIDLIIEKVAIISPYSHQVARIKEAVSRLEGFSKENTIDVNTVDGFQGKEKSIIIFSTVRSKGSRTIGFLSDERRMNVGLSRAKSSLIVVGDSKKLIQDKNWEKLVKYAFKNATFYKIKGKIKDYFKDFQENHKKFLVNNEETFVKMIYTSK